MFESLITKVAKGKKIKTLADILKICGFDSRCI